MGKRTGNPRGRPKGAKNKHTADRERAVKAAAKRLEDALPGAFEGDSHALLMTVYKDPAQEWPIRIDAAKAAIRYEKPSLAAIEHTGKGGAPLIPPKFRVVLVKPSG